MNTVILAIESSCDETGAAIIKDGEIIALVEEVMKSKELVWNTPHQEEFENY